MTLRPLVMATLLAGLASAADAQTNLQTAGAPQTAMGAGSLATAAGQPALSTAPAPPVQPLPTPGLQFQPRSAVQCADFKRAQGGGWSALTAIQLPGPRGPAQIAIGQTFTPGDYGAGFDVAAVLQRDCPQAPPAS